MYTIAITTGTATFHSSSTEQVHDNGFEHNKTKHHSQFLISVQARAAYSHDSEQILKTLLEAKQRKKGKV